MSGKNEQLQKSLGFDRKETELVKLDKEKLHIIVRDYDILSKLERGGLNQTKISNSLGITKSSITEKINDLKSLDLVKIEEVGREKNVRLTDKGLNVLFAVKSILVFDLEREVEECFRKLDIRENGSYCDEDVEETAIMIGISSKRDFFLDCVSRIVRKMNLKKANILNARAGRKLPSHPTDMSSWNEFVKVYRKNNK